MQQVAYVTLPHWLLAREGRGSGDIFGLRLDRTRVMELPCPVGQPMRGRTRGKPSIVAGVYLSLYRYVDVLGEYLYVLTQVLPSYGESIPYVPVSCRRRNNASEYRRWRTLSCSILKIPHTNQGAEIYLGTTFPDTS